MERKNFLWLLASSPLIYGIMKLNTLKKWAESFPNNEQMPVMFVGHGSPMNAIQDNKFTTEWENMSQSVIRPKAILCISAHWETEGSWITAMKQPQTIHDFGGFPEELFSTQYPTPGNPELASEISSQIKKTSVGLDQRWGLDHGSWSVLKHFYPMADVPVLQMSIDYTKPPEWHYEFAKELSFLRKKGILIIGSGNMVHNLGNINWKNDKSFDWAIEAHSILKQKIETRDHKALIDYKSLGTSVKMAVPTNEHYIPMLYALALQEKDGEIKYFNDQLDMGSIAMTSMIIS